MKQRIQLSPVLIIKSLGILGMAYIPVPGAGKPTHEFISKTYARPTGEQRWKASEIRKQQIIAEIRKIRKRIRLKAETLYLEQDKKKIVAYSAKEKTTMHCIRLILKIDNYNTLKRKKDESNMDYQRKVTVDFNTL